MKRYIFPAVMAAFACGCGYNDFGEAAPPVCETVAANADIAFVASIYRGTPLSIDDDIIVSGIVTANDLSDNFYRTFIIQDATGGIEIMAGIFDLHNYFPLGRRVAVKARGLALDSYNGVARLGLKPAAGSSQAGYIATRYYPGGYFWPQDERSEVAPAPLDLAELTESACGSLVRIEGIVFAPGDLEGEYITWAERGTNGYRVFRDGAGNEVTVVTSGYASFADAQVPRGMVALTGILMKGNTDKSQGAYMLKLRSADDVEE